MGDNGSVHELGLLSGVVDVVVQAADQRTIRRVALRVGARSGVVPEALHAAWPIASLGTVCADAELTVEHIEATVWCPTCAAEQQIDWDKMVGPCAAELFPERANFGAVGYGCTSAVALIGADREEICFTQIHSGG